MISRPVFMNVWMVGDSASRFSASPGGDERRTATDSRAATVAGSRGRSGAICLGSHSAKKSPQQQLLQAITMARSRRSSIQFRNEAVLPDRVLAHYGSETKDVRVGWHAVCEYALGGNSCQRTARRAKKISETSKARRTRKPSSLARPRLRGR